MLVAWLGRLLARIVGVVTTHPVRRDRRLHYVRRIAGLLVVMTLLLQLPIRLSPHSARVIVGWLVAIGIVAALTALTTVRRVLKRIAECDPIVLFGGRIRIEAPERPVRMFEGAMALVRRGGVAMPALVFFCGWGAINMLIWAHDPSVCSADPSRSCTGAFVGAGAHPTFGDFLYYSTNLAFANPPPDLVAHSRTAHTAATIEVLSGVGLVTLFAGAFFGVGRRPGAGTEEVGAPEPAGPTAG